MKKTVDEINKMIMEDAPMEEINDAIGYIDICSCFDPIFEPPIDFLEECRKRWEAAQSSFCKTIECKIGNTWHVICLLYTSPSPRDGLLSRMPSSA